MSYITFSEAERIGDSFLKLLTDKGIQPPIHSALENEFLSLTQLMAIFKNPNCYSSIEQDNIVRTSAGFFDFAAKVLSVARIEEFDEFLPHLRLINDRKYKEKSILQNATCLDDDMSRKMTELYIACLVAHIGTKIELDDPNHSKGKNPDIIFNVKPYISKHQYETQTWAIAIKTISTTQGQTIFDRIQEAAHQIDVPDGKWDHGMITINTRDALNHDELWNADFPDLESANENRPQEEWEKLFKNKVVRPILFLGQSVVRLPTHSGNKTPTALKILLGDSANGIPNQVALNLCEYMNHFMQDISHGIPGSIGVPPK